MAGALTAASDDLQFSKRNAPFTTPSMTSLRATSYPIRCARRRFREGCCCLPPACLPSQSSRSRPSRSSGPAGSAADNPR